MTSKHWDEHVRRVEEHTLKGWLDWEFIEDNYIRPQVSGDRNVYYLQYFLDNNLSERPVARALSLGCGGGNLERALLSMDAAREIDAYDVSEESIRLAKTLATEAGFQDRVHYEVRNIDQLVLPPKTYDFVIAKMSLHHFEQLEYIYSQIAATLKDSGVFVFNEFVGPSRFQWTDLQLELMNEILKAVPEKNRWSNWAQQVLTRIDRPSVTDMIAMDPSEAVRSAEILPTLEEWFEIVDYKPYGGTLLHILLTHTMASYDLEDPDQQALLRMIFLFEKTLIQHEVIPSDFAYVVARPHGGAAAKTAEYRASRPSAKQEVIVTAKRALRPLKPFLRRVLPRK